MFVPLALVALLVAPQGGGPQGGGPQGGAQPLVTMSVTPETVAVGEPFTVRVRVRVLSPAGGTVRFPAVPDSALSVEALDPRAIEDHSTRSAFDQTAVYRFVAWEPGRRSVSLGSVSWEAGRGTGSSREGSGRVTVATRLVPVVEVTSVLPQDTTEQEPRAARDPFAPPPEWWRWVVAAVAVLAVLWMAWRLRRRRQRVARAPDPFVDAQAAFAAVDQLAFDEAGEPGRAVLAYAEVMREYLTRRFPMATEGLTTREYVRVLADNALPILPDEVQWVLDAADAVKFAGARVDGDGVRLLARNARGIVRDVQTAYEVRMAAAEQVPGRRRRRRGA